MHFVGLGPTVQAHTSVPALRCYVMYVNYTSSRHCEPGQLARVFQTCNTQIRHETRGRSCHSSQPRSPTGVPQTTLKNKPKLFDGAFSEKLRPKPDRDALTSPLQP